MKFKENIKILTENNKWKEIKGATIPFEDGIVKVELLIHMSENAWTPDAVDVSEKSTGCRLFSIEDKQAKDLKPNDIIKYTSDFINTKGKKVFLAQIKKQLNSYPELYVQEITN